MESSSQFGCLDLHEFIAPNEKSHSVVGIVGSWDNWKTQTHLPHGKGSPCVPLVEGFTYSYKFIIDGEWTIDEGAPIVLDARGNQNNLVTIPYQSILAHAMKFKITERLPKRKWNKRARQTIRKIFRIKKAAKVFTEEEQFPMGDTCKICLCRYPKHRMYRDENSTSDCHHSMCFDCFEQYILRSIETHQLPMTCPECGDVTDPRGVEEIPIKVRKAYHHDARLRETKRSHAKMH